jgi:hypothetical protein
VPRQWETALMAKQLRVPGHTLPWEGRVSDYTAYWGVRGGSGRTHCSCGEQSPELPSTAARQRWHREHKEAFLAEQEAVVGAEPAAEGS